MKKLTTTILTLILFVLAFTLASCNSKDIFTEQTFTSAGHEINAITIDVQDRAIDVSLSEDNLIHIKFFESTKEFYKISTDNNHLKMELLQNKEWKDYIGAKPSAENRKISLQIPHALLSSLIISTTNENIKISSIIVSENISLSCSGGDIAVENIDAGKAVTLTAKNGDIKGTIIGSLDEYSISCIIKKGKCNLPLQKTEGSKSLTARCNNGEIKIDFIDLS